MDVADSWLIVAFLVCLGLSAFFSSAESAFISLPKLRIRYLVESGVKGAEKLARVAEKPERFLATVLLGNNLVNIAAATLGTIIAVAAFGAVKGPIIAIFGVTALILVFGEVIPKTFAMHHAQRLSLIYANPLKIIELCFYPLILALERIGLSLTRIVTVSEEDKKLISEGEIRSAISAGESEGVVEQDEAKILHQVFEFTDRPVSKIMVPRTEIIWVAQGTKLSDFLNLYTQGRYSRFPVYKDNTDNVVGILHAKDVLMKLTDGSDSRDSVIDDLVRPTYFVPEGKRLGELLAEMRDGGHHAAIVVDEFGGISGMVTLGQLTEEIVGDIHDELTDQEKDFIVTGDSTFQLDGGFRVEEANEELKLNLPSGDYETVAGFIFSHLGRIPKQGEHFKYQNLKFVITEMRGMKIEKVIVTKEKGVASS
ncbi:MAG: HlyC/CorC family transporter [Dehalococcoidia bacterium]|nr:MAG: HlyC/CorC family transporter [Dehalococcoidia bacterium]